MRYISSSSLKPGTSIHGKLCEITQGAFGQERYRLETDGGSVMLDSCKVLRGLVNEEALNHFLILTFNGSKEITKHGESAYCYDWALEIIP